MYHTCRSTNMDNRLVGILLSFQLGLLLILGSGLPALALESGVRGVWACVCLVESVYLKYSLFSQQWCVLKQNVSLAWLRPKIGSNLPLGSNLPCFTHTYVTNIVAVYKWLYIKAIKYRTAPENNWICYIEFAKSRYNYRIAGYFRGVYISRTAKFNSCSRKVISRMEILNRASSTLIIFHDFNFRGLAVLSRNSRNINASKMTRYTVLLTKDQRLLSVIRYGITAIYHGLWPDHIKDFLLR